jgi:hypothetical protein
MYCGIGRSLGLAAARSGTRSTTMAARQMMRSTPSELIARTPTFSAKPTVRPFSVLGASPLQKILPEQLTAPTKKATAVPPVLAASQNEGLQQIAQKAEATGAIESIKRNGMIFEIGLTFTITHYQSIFVYVARGVFQSVRPLLILFGFSQILKAVFFIAGAPIWFSFYSIWMFEVGYGLFQCMLSFIFICSFYNNLSFARIRPTVAQLFRQEREKLARFWRALA